MFKKMIILGLVFVLLSTTILTTGLYVQGRNWSTYYILYEDPIVTHDSAQIEIEFIMGEVCYNDITLPGYVYDLQYWETSDPSTIHTYPLGGPDVMNELQTVTLTNLKPDTEYTYTGWGQISTSNFEGTPETITFRTDPIDASSLVYGDLNEDGTIDSTDYALLKRHVLSISQLSPKQKILADLNGDGIIDSTDCVLLQRYIIGTIDKFPVEKNYENIINLPDGEIDNIVLHLPPYCQKTITGKDDINTIVDMVQGINVLEQTYEEIVCGYFIININFDDGTKYNITYNDHLIKDDNRYEIEFTNGDPFDLFDELDYPLEPIDFDN
ncbi:dockerin type I domain-containing protein [Herbivorax sp. ANBcel31]|uniref:dockerin type I domain-containing protein n=1 Tax=Herbivorax sp. ANBcel31 TaxID=3069754 RepID=UPI0027B199EA|nr:dockerin type I domain-containing protein [Herbivorax sp. ANBcel31]MDQ2086310.1 dockerin type I domain-containing protein [Herbivorax sp. ANBcel31]